MERRNDRKDDDEREREKERERERESERERDRERILIWNGRYLCFTSRAYSVVNAVVWTD